MNSLVLFPQEVRESAVAVLEGARARYAFDTHGVREGQSLKVAVMGGRRGQGRILFASIDKVTIELALSDECLEPIPVSLLVGVSRPQTIKKVIQAAVMFGVSSLHLVRSEKGEKSYLQSRSLDEESIEEEALKALEQIWDSRKPEIVVHRTFSYFIENKLSTVAETLMRESGVSKVHNIVAHPGGVPLRCGDSSLVHGGASIIAIGPERGWSDGEINVFDRCGFHRIGLGERVVRVELALVFLLGKLDLLRAS
jgi:16S rRNA (uracil1498-N3)-methyltransferase